MECAAASNVKYGDVKNSSMDYIFRQNGLSITLKRGSGKNIKVSMLIDNDVVYNLSCRPQHFFGKFADAIYDVKYSLDNTAIVNLSNFDGAHSNILILKKIENSLTFKIVNSIKSIKSIKKEHNQSQTTSTIIGTAIGGIDFIRFLIWTGGIFGAESSTLEKLKFLLDSWELTPRAAIDQLKQIKEIESYRNLIRYLELILFGNLL